MRRAPGHMRRVGGACVTAVTVMLIDSRWLSQQQTLRDKARADNNDVRGLRNTGRKSPYTACGSCDTEFEVGDIAVSKSSHLYRKRWCAGCAVRLGVCSLSEVRALCTDARD